jgi:sulfopyruvate decarboxylase subunit alpha
MIEQTVAAPSPVVRQITEELASCGVKLVASLPDTWLTGLMTNLDADERFLHIPVNREESAIGLCAGAYMGEMGSAALMGASGFMTVVYAITKINYTYEIPLLLLVTMRGGLGDAEKHHVSNGLYLERVIQAINMPYTILDRPEKIGLISRIHKQSQAFARPMLLALTRDLMRGA